MSETKIIIKKVNAFPFGVQFKTDTAAFAGKIMKLTRQGFLAEVAVTTLQPLEKMECAFTLPVLHKSVSEHVVVVKIYNHYVPASAAAPTAAPSAAPSTPTAGVAHLVEMHFQSPSIAGAEAVQSFLSAIERHK